jgi:hypothetical protein
MARRSQGAPRAAYHPESKSRTGGSGFTGSRRPCFGSTRYLQRNHPSGLSLRRMFRRGCGLALHVDLPAMLPLPRAGEIIPRIFRIMKFPRDCPHGAGDGPRPVRAGSAWPVVPDRSGRRGCRVKRACTLATLGPWLRAWCCQPLSAWASRSDVLPMGCTR